MYICNWRPLFISSSKKRQSHSVLNIANTVQCRLAYLFLFFGHLSFQLLFHSVFIFLNFQFYWSFLLVVLFQWLDIELVYPQVKKCFQNLQQKLVKWKTWKWKSLRGALGSFSPTPKSSLDKFSLFWKYIWIRVDKGLDLMRILADVIVVTFLLISIRVIPLRTSPYTADSIKVALGIGNCALESYCFVITQVNHCIVPYVQWKITKATFFDLAVYKLVSFSSLESITMELAAITTCEIDGWQKR